MLQAAWAVSGSLFCVCKFGYSTAVHLEPVGACALDVIGQTEISKPSTVRAGIIHGKRLEEASPGDFSDAQHQGGKGIQRLEPGKAVLGSRVEQLLLPAFQGGVQLLTIIEWSSCTLIPWAHPCHGSLASREGREWLHVRHFSCLCLGRAGQGTFAQIMPGSGKEKDLQGKMGDITKCAMGSCCWVT